MPLPKIATPTYELELPSTKETIQYRPFLVKEEKLLVLALEGENTKEITTAIKNVIKSCIHTKGIKVEILPTFDIEYLFLNIRGKSVGEEIEVNIICPDDGETYVPVKINIDDIKVKEIEEHTNKIKVDSVFSDKVALIQVYPGQNPEILDFYAEKGYKGIILEVAGIGQVPTQDGKYNWLPKLKKTVEKGIVVCATPQTINGMLNPKVYSAGRDIEKTGIIYLKDMLPETGFVKLSWVLGHKDWAKSKEIVKEKMLFNFSGEFNERLGFEF